MKITILILLVTLSSCSIFEEHHYRVEPALATYVNSFYKEAYARGVEIPRYPSVIFSNDVHPGAFFVKSNEVKLNQEHIFYHLLKKTKADTAMVMLEVYHELGHSIGKAHRGPFMSIMNAGDGLDGKGDFIRTVQYFNAHPTEQNGIIDELFSK